MGNMYSCCSWTQTPGWHRAGSQAACASPAATQGTDIVINRMTACLRPPSDGQNHHDCYQVQRKSSQGHVVLGLKTPRWHRAGSPAAPRQSCSHTGHGCCRRIISVMDKTITRKPCVDCALVCTHRWKSAGSLLACTSPAPHIAHYHKVMGKFI
jgi:hypothetical protein